MWGDRNHVKFLLVFYMCVLGPGSQCVFSDFSLHTVLILNRQLLNITDEEKALRWIMVWQARFLKESCANSRLLQLEYQFQGLEFLWWTHVVYLVLWLSGTMLHMGTMARWHGGDSRAAWGPFWSSLFSVSASTLIPPYFFMLLCDSIQAGSPLKCLCPVFLVLVSSTPPQKLDCTMPFN